MTTTRGTTFTTTVRMIDRVHRHTADGRADTHPALGAGLADLLEVVLAVAHLADRGAAVGGNLAHLARTQAQRGITLFAGDQLRRGAGRTGDLSLLARLH